MKTKLDSTLHLISDDELKRLIWEEWESEIKEEDPRQMVFKYMVKMREACLLKNETIVLPTTDPSDREKISEGIIPKK